MASSSSSSESPISTHYLPDLFTACVTPFTAGGKQVDTVAFKQLLQQLVLEGSDGLLINGTTGETPALSFEEKIQQIEIAVQIAKSANTPIHVMAGISGNATQKVVAEIEQTLALVQPHSLLVVVPYYNKPSQLGMIAHFSACVEAAKSTPIVIYNIPGRTGVAMTAETMAELHALFPTQILGVKQSAPDMDAVSQIRGLLPPTFHVWCGDDSLTLPMLALGAIGTVSVVGNVAAGQLRWMIMQFKAGHLTEALRCHQALFPVVQGLFKLTNPIIVKAILAHQQKMQPDMRLPMLPPTPVEAMTFVTPIASLIGGLAPVDASAFRVDAENLTAVVSV
jgi:4-hydroxy-tetrahydrodipicolinate synthase